MKTLKVKGITKKYKSYRHEIFRLLSWFGFPFKPVKEIEVLKDISFELKEGETLGLIGQNGAGKSTLLKIITGTTAPTSGTVEVNGTISAILELGMGFHPELTGRQNARHSLALQGRTEDEIDQVIEEVKAFSEIGDYFEQPIRTYSSGMQMRVAFSVATAFRPDFLIVDEAFAVGDAKFQAKCFARIKTFQKKGTALILVSHDRHIMQNLCRRGVLLANGRIVFDGASSKAASVYNASFVNSDSQIMNEGGWVETGNRKAEVVDVRFDSIAGEGKFAPGEDIVAVVKYVIKEDLNDFTFGFQVVNAFGYVIFGSNSLVESTRDLQATKGEHSVMIKLPAVLRQGVYQLYLNLHSDVTHISNCFHMIEGRYSFRVMPHLDRLTIGELFVQQSIFRIR